MANEQQAGPLSPEQIIAKQREEVERQRQAAIERDRAMFGPAVEDPAAAVAAASRFTQQQSTQAAPQQQQQPPQQPQSPYQTQPPMPPQQQPPQGFNLPPGMTPQQIAQGVQPASLQDLASANAQEPDKPRILWHPARNSSLEIELEDSVIGGLIESLEQETDPQAKVVGALLSEILSLRARVAQLEQGGGGAMRDEELAARVYRLEMTLFEQTQALNQQARAMREEAERQAREEAERGGKEES